MADENNSRFIDDEIVISGISGRFPGCNSVEEFYENLMKGVDLVKEDDSRWPKGFLGTNPRMGLINSLKKFDASFFGVHPKLAERTDPIVRVLLQTSFEAILDAGISPTELRGTETGVIVVVSSNEAADWWSSDPDIVNGYEFLGCTRTMYSNRISFVFDLRGPSYTMDCQSASSLAGLEQGYYMLKNGTVDAVIVAGVNLILNPHFNIMFQKLNLLSPDGKCKVFDTGANGYARSEAGVAVILQRKLDARRVYAEIAGIGSNCDGYKTEGCTSYCSQSKLELYTEIYNKFRINPLDVTYIEVHGYATEEGDASEANSITEMFCKGRDQPLLVGCVKTNMGDSEPVSGLVSLVKVLLIFEQNLIPGNLHYKYPNRIIKSLTDGDIQVVDKLTAWNGKLIAINSFGIGGMNGHVVLRPNIVSKSSSPYSDIPRLLLVTGRTENSARSFLHKVKARSKDMEFCNLVYKIFEHNIPRYDYRAFSVTGQEEEFEEIQNFESSNRPTVFVFSGMGSQWVGMGKDLLKLKVFKSSIDRCAEVLKKEGFDLYSLLLNTDKAVFNDVLNSFVGITCIQIALVDTLREIGIIPDYIVGHSVGELACAYADETLSLEQTVLATYWRGKCLLSSDIPAGSMAAVGLSSEAVAQRISSDISVACHNSPNNVTISGPPKSVSNFTELLRKEGVFAKQVDSSGLAFHSKYIACAGPHFKQVLKKIIPEPKLRSKRWLSTSVPEKDWKSKSAQYSSVDYHLNNLLSPVLFQEALSHVPDDSVVIEIAPHALLQPILKNALGKKCTHVGLVRKSHSTVIDLLINIGRMFNAGLQPKIATLYDSVTCPVGRTTPMIQSLIEWDHSQDWFLVSFLMKPAGMQGENTKIVDVSSCRYKFLLDSVVDGVPVLPVASYVSMIWETVAKFQYKQLEHTPLVIKDLQILKKIVLSEKRTLNFEINILERNQECEIRESGTLVARAVVKLCRNIENESSSLTKLSTVKCSSYLPLKSSDIYKDLRAKGYFYGGIFKGLVLVDNTGTVGRISWNENWTAFIDAMFQLHLLNLPTSEHQIIDYVEKVVLDPEIQFQSLNSNSKESGIQVTIDTKLHVIKAAGVEMMGIRSRPEMRRSEQKTSTVEYVTFIPHLSNKIMDKKIAISIIGQIIIENNNIQRPLRILEFIDKSTVPCIQHISEVFRNDQRIEAHLEFCGQHLDSNTATGAKEGRLKPVGKYDIVVGSDQHFEVLKDVLTLLDDGSYILLSLKSTEALEVKINLLDLKLIARFSTCDGTFVLIRKPLMWKTPMVIHVKHESFMWVESVKAAIRKHEIDGRETMLIFHGNEPNGVVGFLQSVRCEYLAPGLRCLITDNSIQPYKIVDLTYIDYLRKGLVFNIFKNGEWGSFVRLPVDNTFTAAKLTDIPQSIATMENSISSKFCYVYYASLCPYSLQEARLNQEKIFGYEFAGINENGERVFGIAPGGSLSSVVPYTEDLVWRVPEGWTLPEASVTSAIYSAANNALIARANLKKHETLYINSPPLEITMAAWIVATAIGAKVYIGYSNQREKKVLKDVLKNVNEYDLINTKESDFVYELLSRTEGKGIDTIFDVVSDGLNRDRFLTVLSVNGRLVEFDKGLSFKESLGHGATEKNVTFHKVTPMDILMSNENSECRQKIKSLVQNGIDAGLVKPIIPFKVFDDLEEAKRYLRSGTAIGKAVLKIREERDGALRSSVLEALNEHMMPLVSPKKCYIVTGGLTYLGTQLVNYLIREGARNVVICSPYQPITGYQQLQHRKWVEAGAEVVISDADLNSLEGTETLITEAKNLGSIEGIFHFATISCKVSLEESTPSHFQLPWKTKVDSAKNLDVVSRRLCPDLKYFVGLSSKSSKCSSNVAYCHSTMGSVYTQRKEDGYSAVVIELSTGDYNIQDVTWLPLEELLHCLRAMQQVPGLNCAVISVPNFVCNSYTPKIKLENLEDSVAEILGIKDVEQIGSLSLQEIGLESVSFNEIKKLFHASNINYEDEVVRQMTFEEIRSDCNN